MSDKDLPQGIALTPLDEAFKRDPYAVFKTIQAATKVHEDTELKRFIYTHHDDVKTILRDADFWSDPRKGNPGTFSREFLGATMIEDEDPSMLLMDEPGHRRLRSLVSASFTPKAVERWRGRTRAAAGTSAWVHTLRASKPRRLCWDCSIGTRNWSSVSAALTITRCPASVAWRTAGSRTLAS